MQQVHQGTVCGTTCEKIIQHMRRGEEKKSNPQTMPQWGSTVWEQKKHLSNKSTHTLQHEHMTCNRGGEWGVEVIQPRQAAIRPDLQPLLALVTDPLVRLGDQSGEGVGWG